MKRILTIAILAMLLAVAAARTSTVSRLVSSAREFERNFHSLQTAESIGSLERLMLSLVLTS